MKEDEMVGWHQQLNGREFEQTPGDTVKDGEAWRAAVHGVAKSRTRLNDRIAASVYMLEGTKNNGKENKAYKNGRKSQQLRLALVVLKQGALAREVTCEEGTEVSARAA